jgi:hypothetical protein
LLLLRTSGATSSYSCPLSSLSANDTCEERLCARGRGGPAAPGGVVGHPIPSSEAANGKTAESEGSVGAVSAVVVCLL